MKPLQSNVFLAAKQAYAAEGTPDVLAKQIAYALSAPDGVVFKRTGAMVIGWWLPGGPVPTFYVARMDGEGVLAADDLISELEAQADKLGYPRTVVRVCWWRRKRGAEHPVGMTLKAGRRLVGIAQKRFHQKSKGEKA